jgi:hypothetical protein
MPDDEPGWGVTASLTQRVQAAGNLHETLNIPLLTERAIYQSADLRLMNTDTGAVIIDAPTKLVTLQYFECDGFVTYRGVGA